MKKMIKIGFALLLVFAAQSCKKEVASTTEMEVQTQHYSDTMAVDTTLMPMENTANSGTGNRINADGNAATKSDNVNQSSSTGTSSTATSTEKDAKSEPVTNNAVDPYYNGSGTKSGSKSGVHTGSGSNAGQGSSTASGNSKK